MWSDNLEIIRRFLRDPEGNIWSDAYLRHMWNDVQRDLQNRTSVLEDVIAQRVPDIYHFAYQHDWEWRHIPTSYSEFYRCLISYDSLVVCHSWEPQEVVGIDSDATDIGCHFTQPWEAFSGLEPGEEVRMKFPRNFRTLKFIAYDEEPISQTTRKMVQSCDSSYINHSGRPIAFYTSDDLDNSYVLYPRPSTAFADEVDGNEGVAFFVEDDSEDISVGTIAVRTGSNESGGGASVDVVGLTDNVLMIYDINPTDIVNEDDEPDFPVFLHKYLRYGVISRAYDANTDGRIPSLARLWAQRYELGVNVVKRYMRNRANDRDYRFMTQPATTGSRRRLPRLPATYPDP